MAPFHFVSDTCTGEKCRICGEDATHKVGEEIPPDHPSNHHDPITNAAEFAAIGTIQGVAHSLVAYVCCDHFRMIVGPAAPCTDPEKPPYEDGFICGTGLDDPENASWTHEVYETRAEAVAAGNADVTWVKHGEGGFETASIHCRKSFMPNPLSAESACDCAEHDEFGEGMLENWQDKVFGQGGKLIEELQATLDKVWSDFEDKHKLWSWGIWFDDVKSHEFGPVDDEGEPVGDGFVPWGDREPRTNGGETCDMWTGPCACGATHADGV